MASTYALPITPASHSHSHGRSRSQYTPEPAPYLSNVVNGASPAKEHGHRTYRADMNGSGQLHGAVRSPYAEYNGHEHEHEHGHERGQERPASNTPTYTFKPLLSARPKHAPRGESDLGRSPVAKTAVAEKYGFSPVSPIQETAPHTIDTPHAHTPPVSS
jgi:zinc transporter 5/7